MIFKDWKLLEIQGDATRKYFWVHCIHAFLKRNFRSYSQRKHALIESTNELILYHSKAKDREINTMSKTFERSYYLEYLVDATVQ